MLSFLSFLKYSEVSPVESTSVGFFTVEEPLLIGFRLPPETAIDELTGAEVSPEKPVKGFWFLGLLEGTDVADGADTNPLKLEKGFDWERLSGFVDWLTGINGLLLDSSVVVKELVDWLQKYQLYNVFIYCIVQILYYRFVRTIFRFESSSAEALRNVPATSSVSFKASTSSWLD